ncbi:MAG: hypothetical protein LUQ25_06200 [Methanoregulaceae archaeon]|nr:hypothetical protein [Methanoregulaceae archaeon]
MNDVEKIVLYFFLHKKESAPACQIQKWAMLSRDRMNAAFNQCGGKVFLLEPNPDDQIGYTIRLLNCPEIEKIVKKHADLLGLNGKR